MKRLLLAVATLLLSSLALGQDGAPVATFNPPAATVIFSNLGPAGKVYYKEAYLISGPKDQETSLQWIAAPFTPQTDTSITGIQVAAFYYNSDPNTIAIALYADDRGFPGSLIHSWTAQNLPTWPTCCPLLTLSAPSIPVTAGTQYWLAAQTNRASETSDEAWAWNWSEALGTIAEVEKNYTGWHIEDEIVPAFAVYGPPE